MYAKEFLMARRPPKVSNKMKFTNEKMTWNKPEKLCAQVAKELIQTP